MGVSGRVGGTAPALVVNRGDQNHSPVPRVVNGHFHGPAGGRRPEPHADHPGAAVRGPEDPLRHCGGGTPSVVQRHFRIHQGTTRRHAGHAHAVAADRGGNAGQVRPLTEQVIRCGGGRKRLAGDDLPRQIGVCGCDA